MGLGQKKAGQKGWGPFNAEAFKNEISRWQTFANDLDGSVTLFLENHNLPRSITRFGSDSSLDEQIRSRKIIAVVQLTKGIQSRL